MSVGYTIARPDWPPVASVIKKERSGQLDPPAHRPERPTIEPYAKGVRCVLAQQLLRGQEAKARILRVIDNRQSVDVRIVDYSEPFRLESDGGTTEPLTNSSKAPQIKAALIAIGFDVTDVLIAGSRWLITYRIGRVPQRSFSCDRPAYEVSVGGPHSWSVDDREIEVTDPYDRLPPDAVDDNATLADGAEAKYVAGLIGVAITGIDGEYFFDVPHLYESVTVRPVTVKHQLDGSAGTTCVCEIMHVEADLERSITREDDTTLVPVPDDYDAAAIYTDDPATSSNSPLVGRPCSYVPTGLYLVAHNPRPNELVPEGFYFAVLAGGVWVVDNQASWLEYFK